MRPWYSYGAWRPHAWHVNVNGDEEGDLVESPLDEDETLPPVVSIDEWDA